MRRFLIVSIVILVPITSTLRPARAEITADQVRTAIDRGIGYLKREQSPRGTWDVGAGPVGGVTALCTLALLNAGVPADDPHVQRALNELRKIKPSKTYTTSLQTMVFCAAEPKRDLVLIRRNAKWLEETQIKTGSNNGVWSYPGASGDNSNAQFAVLALHEAERVGVKVSEQTWTRAHNYWKRVQRPEGSWGYVEGAPDSGSMTCAGIAGLVITSGKVTPGDARVVDGRVQCCGEHEEDDDLERALAWLGRNFSVQRNPGNDFRAHNYLYYYLYALERVGRLTAHRFIGGHDWYREGAEMLVDAQDSISGFWKGRGHAEDKPLIATSMALLFLSKGRRPVVIAKLKHPPGDDWNHHRSDLAGLVAHTESRWERDLTWQVIDGKDATVDDLLQTPVLFIGGRESPQFSEEEAKHLREYIDRGGFIFAESACQGGDFDRGFHRLMDVVFPEPEYQLRLLPPNHPAWDAEEKVDPGLLRPLWGIDYSCRTSVVYLPPDESGVWANPISCFWELGVSGRERSWPGDVQNKIGAANAIGVNILTYATGRNPKYKDEIPQQLVQQDADLETARGTLYVAKLKHSGGCNAAPGALANLLRTASAELDVRVSTSDRQINITDPDLFRHHLVFMHGRHAFQLTPAESDALRAYLERGGMLFADAICASREFAESFRREMKAILPDAPLEHIPVSHALFSPDLGGYDIRTVTRRDPASRRSGDRLQANLQKVEPLLEGMVLGKRYAVVFSPFDISCALEQHESLECSGYIRQDAARIGLNVLLYSLHQ